MDTYWQKLRFLRSQGLKTGLGKAGRVAASLGLIFTMLGPSATFSPATPAFADDLEWTCDSRPPLTDLSDDDGDDCYTALPAYGDVFHAIKVAPNGDIFTSGAAGEFFKSTDGGMSWRSATGALAGLVRDIAVSPNYPSDNFVVVVFSDLDSAEEAVDGLAYSTDGGETFTTAFTGAIAIDVADVELRAVALSPDFDFGDGDGEMAVGGTWAGADAIGTVYKANADDFAAAPAGDQGVTWNAVLSTLNAEGQDDSTTLSLAYGKDADGDESGLARIVVAADGFTYGQVTTSNDFNDTDRSGLIDDAAAVAGQIAFDNSYEDQDDGVWAAVSFGDGSGGVFSFDSGWDNETADEVDCAGDWASISVIGAGTSVRVVVGDADGKTVCRSTNGTSYTDQEIDDEDQVDAAAIADGVVMVAIDPNNTSNVYATTSGDLGGVVKSTNGGAAFMDTGLTNDPYVVSSVTEITATTAFAKAEWNHDADATTSVLTAMFYTANYGSENTDWQRVDRTPNIDGIEDAGSAAGVFYLTRVSCSGTVVGNCLAANVTEERFLKSTDSGMHFFPLAVDPEFDEEDFTASSFRSATTVYVGTSEGNIYYTTDGGGSWQQQTTNIDFDGEIDEFDFVTSPTVFIVTAYELGDFHLYLTKDSGATFTEVPGGTPWDAAEADSITTDQVGYTDIGAGTLFVRIGGDMWRLAKAGTEWTDLEVGFTTISSFTGTGARPGMGDGREYFLWDNTGAGVLLFSWNLLAGDPDDMDWDAGTGFDDPDDDDATNLLTSVIPAPSGASTIGTRGGTAMRTLQNTSGGGVWELTLTDAWRSGITTVSPTLKASVQTNVGDEGPPVTFRWNDVADADEFEVLIGLEADLESGEFIGNTGSDFDDHDVATNNILTVDGDDYALVQGNTYYWKVRVKVANGEIFEGPWSATQSFSVSPPGGVQNRPEPQLPLDGSTSPNVGPIQFSFNLPSGTTQYHIQIVPLNNDGPAIDMIVGDPALVSQGTFTAQPPVMGQGNYVLLPGATYTWRVRASTATGSITATDGSWGQWSEVRTLRTPRPNAGSISLQAVGTGNVTTDTTPTLSWKDSNVNNFYYEIQLSGDPAFNQDPATATSFVYHNLIHGGVSNPLNSWTVPDSAALPKGRAYWRVRQRVQATNLGADEPGVGWSATSSFVVQ